MEKSYQACVLLSRHTHQCTVYIARPEHGIVEVYHSTIKQAAVGKWLYRDDLHYVGGTVDDNFRLLIDSAIKAGTHKAVWRSFSSSRPTIFAAAGDVCMRYRNHHEDLFKAPTQWFNNGRPSQRGKK